MWWCGLAMNSPLENEDRNEDALASACLSDSSLWVSTSLISAALWASLARSSAWRGSAAPYNPEYGLGASPSPGVKPKPGKKKISTFILWHDKIWFCFHCIGILWQKAKLFKFRVFPDLLRIQFVLFDFMLFIWCWYALILISRLLSSELIFWYLDSVFKWYLQYNQVKAVLMGSQLKLP